MPEILPRLSTSMITVSLLGEPVGSTLLACLVFGEGLDLWKIVGGCLIPGGIDIAVSGEKQPLL